MPGMNTGFEGRRRKCDTSVFEKVALANGITVWLQRPPVQVDDEGILIVFLPDIGSQADPQDGHGTAHFFEHLPFRGTLNKPSPDLVMNPILSRGGELDASTARNFTSYSVFSPKDDFNLAVETLFEMVAEPLVTPEAVKLESDTIAQEYRRRFSNGDSVATKLVSKAFYNRHPFGHMVIGDLNVISRMTPERLMEFRRLHYHAGNIEIICGGAFTERADILDVLNASFGSLPKSTKTNLQIDSSNLLKNSRRVKIVEPACRRDSLHLIYPIAPRRGTSDYSLRFLAYALADGLHSPLAIELRQKRGWVYEGYLCDTIIDKRLWGFLVRLPVQREHFADAEAVFYKTLANLSEEEIVKRQRERQLSRAMAFQHPRGACVSAVSEIVNWRWPTSHHETERIYDETTIENILAWRDHLLGQTPFVCEIRI